MCSIKGLFNIFSEELLNNLGCFQLGYSLHSHAIIINLEERKPMLENTEKKSGENKLKTSKVTFKESLMGAWYLLLYAALTLSIS